MSKRSLFFKIIFIIITITSFAISTSCNNEKENVVKIGEGDKEMFNACLYSTGGAYAYDFRMYNDKTLKLTMGLTDGKFPPNDVYVKKQDLQIKVKRS